MYKLLLVDDDSEVLELNQRFFEEKKCRVFICADALKAITMIKEQKPDCVLLDVMMPGVDGYELCRKIRKFTNIPVLFLSGKVSEEDKIEGFSCGADDYIEKPYSLTEVYIRIVANIRRNQELLKPKAENKNIIQIYPLTVNLLEHKAFCLDEEICLSNREFELLVMLAQKPNQLITFEDIGMNMWGSYTEDDRKSVMVNMSRLRKKIGSYSGLDNLIETVWSKGYKLIKK